MGYFDMFYRLKSKHMDLTNRNVYEMLESLYFQYYGCKKYSTYGTFRNAKHRYLNRLFNKSRQANKVC